VTCSRCEDLQAELDRVKARLSELQPSLTLDEEMRIRNRLRLNRQEWLLVRALWEANGRPVRTWHLKKAVCPDNPTIEESRIVRVLIYRLRRLFGADAIGNDWGVGYYFTDKGRQVVKKVMEAR